jgi:hypothetical protein
VQRLLTDVADSFLRIASPPTSASPPPIREPVGRGGHCLAHAMPG